MAGSVGVADRADRRGWMSAGRPGCRFDRSCRGVCGDGARVGLLAGIRPARRRVCGRRKPHTAGHPSGQVGPRSAAARSPSGYSPEPPWAKAVARSRHLPGAPGGPPAGEPGPACRPL